MHRHVITTAILFASAITLVIADTQQPEPTPIQKKLTELENSSGGLLGIYAINTENNQPIQHHAEKRFPVQSTCKAMVVAAVLKESMTNSDLLQQKIIYKKDDLVSWSPITEKHIADGMTISELCAAAMAYSDNTATNLLIHKLGGPQAITAFARSIGDDSFQLENLEPHLNSDINELPDTSTPKAMAESLQQLALGNVLAPRQRELFQTWLKGNTTGDTRIRAGVPKNWIVGDKTGSGNYGITNDIAIIWPPKCAPLVVAIYFIQPEKDAKPKNDVIAAATRLLIDEFALADTKLKAEK